MRTLVSWWLAVVVMLHAGCVTPPDKEGAREDREKELLTNCFNRSEIRVAEMRADTQYAILALKNARIEIPRDEFPGEISLFDGVATSRKARFTEYLSASLSLHEIAEGFGVDIRKLEELLRNGRVRVYDLRSQAYLESYLIADYRVYHGPLNASGGVVFLFPDGERVILEIMHWIA